MSKRKKDRSRSDVPAAAAAGEVPARPLAPWIVPVIVALVAAGAVVGAFNPAPHTGGDNAAYVSLAHSLLSDGSYTEIFDPAGGPHTKYPPVFPALLSMLMLVGVRTWAGLKTVAAISTIGGSVLTFLWARRRLGTPWALGVALAVIFSSASVYYSHWILSDPTFVLLTLLSLWALERGRQDRDPDEEPSRRWMGIGIVAAGLAYFTRSAGVPLLIAIVVWLVLRRRWKALAVSAVGIGLPVLAWLGRARGPGSGEYVSEFWLVNPYDPALGGIGVGGLVARFGANLTGYVGHHLPTGIIGGQGPAVAAFGLVLAIAGLAGWALACRRGVGPAEIFLPLYAGLILVWPEVWSGDRFALPLYPLLFFYTALLVRDGLGGPGSTVARVAGAGALLLVLAPSLATYGGWVETASRCKAATRVGGPFACYGPRVGAFVEAAGWAGANLPDGSAVLSRKPRIFFVMSGVPSRAFPFTEDPAAHLDLAEELGARYELLDEWDGLAGRYVAGAVQRYAGAFCGLQGFGDAQRTRLIGILPPGQRTGDPTGGGSGVRIPACPPAYVAGVGATGYSSTSMRIPLLELDP